METVNTMVSQVRAHLHEMVLLTYGASITTSINLIKMIPHMLSQMSIFQTLLDLMINTVA